jgi:hypothetical protein
MPDVAMSTPASVGPVRGCFVSASWSAVSFVAASFSIPSSAIA